VSPYLSYGLAILLGYLLGSFPTGFIAGRVFGNVDVRTVGSGRTGGTNVLRSAGRTAAIVTIVGDILKGVLAVVLARAIWGEDARVAEMTAALAAFFVVYGHNYSIFLKFKGGAGTMTGAGALLALHPFLVPLAGIIPLVMTYITRMSSIGSMLGSAIALLLGAVLAWYDVIPDASLFFFAPFFLLSWYAHRPNIQRLIAGTERRIGDKARA
jgi:acyl phosphate:glycerol-3-phosphate acyltransferase